MKKLLALRCLAAIVLAGLFAPTSNRAATIIQNVGGNVVAFEAEENVKLTPGTPTSFTITNDVTPSGNQALFASGANNTTFPTSFASYAIKFSTPGTYKVFFRWRANEDFTGDPNAANSFHTPNRFGASTNGTLNPNPDYTISTVNNMRVKPESHTYHVDPENTSLLAVSQEQVDAGVPLIFTIGTREAGMMFDRFVLTLDSALTEAQFDATPNSDTDVFVQPSGVNYVAFEAETPKVALTPGTPTSFTITNDVTPSGNQALFASGANNTTFPTSFASYAIKFSTPGTYKVFFRWRANEDFTGDPNAANSFHAPNRFGASTNGTLNPNPDYTISTVNNTRVKPESHTYHVDPENTSLLAVSQEQVDAGVPLIFTIGTREAGMMFDRFALTLDSSLTEAQFNALENTGAIVPPVITRVVASGSLDYVKVSFSKALNQNVDTSSFQISGGVTVLAAVLDLNTLKDIILTTSPQTPGTLYTLVVNDIFDLNDAVIAPNTTTNFYAWALAPGFSKREIYFTIAGTDVNSLLNSPKYPNSPEQVDVVRGLANINLPRARDYGVRLTGFFTPAQTGVYEFFMYNNDEARLSISTDTTPANAQTILTAPATTAMEFTASAMGALPDALTAGQRYYIEVLLKQGNDYDAFVNVAARRQGDPTPISSLLPLSTEISTFVDPAAATLNISLQPASTTAPNGGRARFEVRATSPNGPAFYQWQRNGANIAGATRAAYYTPILAGGNSGDQYRAIIWGGGAVATSAVATVTVSGPSPSTAPLIGINFVGGGTDGPGGTLRSNDVVGVVPQDNYNNLAGGTGTGVALQNADGTPSSITATYNGATWFTGTGESTAENVLFQGYLHSTNTGVSVTLNNVPPGNYHLIAYAVGFNFNAIYDQSMQLIGNVTYPTLHVRAEHAGEYNAAPSIFRRMSSTNPQARDHGNYVIFENVSPDSGGALTLTVLNESPPANVGVGDNPALNGLQLVRVTPPSPALSISRIGGTVTIAWGASAAGFILESSPTLNPAAAWEAVVGTPNPITTAGSISLSPPLGPAGFYRLRQ